MKIWIYDGRILGMHDWENVRGVLEDGSQWAD